MKQISLIITIKIKPTLSNNSNKLIKKKTSMYKQTIKVLPMTKKIINTKNRVTIDMKRSTRDKLNSLNNTTMLVNQLKKSKISLPNKMSTNKNTMKKKCQCKRENPIANQSIPISNHMSLPIIKPMYNNQSRKKNKNI